VAGLASELNKKVSRKGEAYARFVLEDLSGRMEMMIFPSPIKRPSIKSNLINCWWWRDSSIDGMKCPK
jgi:DNA polymerase III alpha subunit